MLTPAQFLRVHFWAKACSYSPLLQLGQFYLVPFKSKAKYDREGQMIEPEKFKAQFVLGYKGYIQLAPAHGSV